MLFNLYAMDLTPTGILTHTLCFCLIYFTFKACILSTGQSAHLNEYITKVSEVPFIWNKGNSKCISYWDLKFGLVSNNSNRAVQETVILY